MSAPDTDHVKMIHAALGNILAGANQDREFDAIMDHADALQRERDEAQLGMRLASEVIEVRNGELAMARARHARIVDRIMTVYASPGDGREDMEYALALDPGDLRVDVTVQTCGEMSRSRQAW